MQRQGQPLRPMPVQGTGELQQLLELARSSTLQPQRSAFSTVTSSQGLLPEFSLYNAAQLSGLLGNNSGISLEHLAQIHQLQNLQSQAGAAALLGSHQALPESSTSKHSMARGASRGDKSSSAYASRHQAAEQRRRTRINDRLDRLRQVVPHSERANTATFLEEVINYVEALHKRLAELETAQGLPLSCPPVQKQNPILSQMYNQQQLNSHQVTSSPASATAAPPFLTNVATFKPQQQQQPSSSTAQQSVGTSAAITQGQKDRPETPPQTRVEEGSSEAVEADMDAAAEMSSGESAQKKHKPDLSQESPK